MSTPRRALARRAFADARVRLLSFALIFFAYPLATIAGYKKTYPTAADRLSFARSFGDNPAVKLFYGTPHHLETLGGYASWRAGGILALGAAFFGAFAAVRALRSEEESGRFEITASGAITRGGAYAARLVAIGALLAALWLACWLGVMAGGLPSGGSAYQALVVIGVAAVYVGVGAVASQLIPTGRGALELAGAVLGLDFLLRVVADTSGPLALHWLMPLGWAEELRAFTGARPAVLLLPLLAATALLLLAGACERRRDIGVAVFAPHDTVRRPRLRLLHAPAALALRAQSLSLAVWAAAVGGIGIVLGSVAGSVASGLSEDLRRRLGKFGGGSFGDASSVIGLYFLFFVLFIALFCCSQIGAARDEEAEGRLETLFALPQGRVAWLAGRLGLAVAGAALIAVVAGLGTAIGGAASGADVSLTTLIGAGLNTLPASLLFLGLGALLIAVAPRLGTGVAYGLVSLAFLWELVGGLLGVPGWLLGVSPFHQIGLVPAQDFRAGPAAIMLAIGCCAAAVALVRFRTRDLVGA
ncbi:MAG TPA: polyketide antibiotic transporter [Dehalococcoidia bacterium]|nr:polyketide antibiotic transporter [Dehalococcoidia bacterium]